MLNHEKIKEIVREIAPKYEIQQVYLFGSHARGDAREDSDFDFRIVGGNMKTLFDLAALHLDLEDALGHEVDIVETQCMRKSFYNRIKAEEVLIYG